MPSETKEANQSILTCHNGIHFTLILLCLIDLDRVTIEKFIKNENMSCWYLTV